MKTAITPGEILLEDYLVPMGISQNALARALGISPRSINEIVLGKRSGSCVLRLSRRVKNMTKLARSFKNTACLILRASDFRYHCLCLLLIIPLCHVFYATIG
mgnify:CR=1 FL=1